MEKVKDLQSKIALELDLLLTEKIHLINEVGSITYKDVIELHIISVLNMHISETLFSIEEEVAVEIMIPWSMVKVHEILLTFHNNQAKVETEDYLDILNKISNRLFLKLFSSHIE